MKKAAIVYDSKTGITRRYAEAIGAHLKSRELEVSVSSVTDFDKAMMEAADYLLLGGWTSGLFVFLQHPDKAWKQFAAELPENPKAKTALFTTYKLLTGSMFANMRKKLDGKVASPSLALKSRSGKLSEADKARLDAFVE